MLDRELETVKKVIKQAGKAALSYYGDNTENDITYKAKGKNAPVTQADLAAEKVILDGLREFDYGVLSEETSKDNDRFNKRRVWVIDPLDGTKDFILANGEFSILIGLVENKKPILGVVYQPIEEKLYYAQTGKGAFLEKKDGEPVKLKVSSQSDLGKMKMFVSRNHLLPHELKFSEKNGVERITCGSAGIKACRIAEQHADIYVNSSDKTGEWDICAGDMIIQEAGGILTDLDGQPIVYNRKDNINRDGFVFSNNQRHQDILDELQACKS